MLELLNPDSYRPCPLSPLLAPGDKGTPPAFMLDRSLAQARLIATVAQFRGLAVGVRCCQTRAMADKTAAERRCPAWRNHPECFYCEEPLRGGHEHDHAPVPKRNGGTAVWCVCTTCHTLKDKVHLDKWRMFDYGLPHLKGLFEKASKGEQLALERVYGFFEASNRTAEFPARQQVESALPALMTLFQKASPMERILLMKIAAISTDLVASGERANTESCAAVSRSAEAPRELLRAFDTFDPRSLR